MSAAGKIYRVGITGYTHEGAGVGRVNGQVVFVPGALLKEEVLVEILGEKRGILRGKLLEVITSHPHRVSPACPVYTGCGGCKFQHVSYSEQLKIKKLLVEDSLRRLVDFSDLKVLPVLGMENPWKYRNKGHFQVGMKAGKIVLGFFEEDTHSIVPQSCYHLFSDSFREVLIFLQELLNCYKIKVQQRDGTGLRYVMIRESRFNGEMLIVFISKGEFSHSKEDIAREICSNFPSVVGVHQNYNEKSFGAVLGDKTRIILGKDRLEDKLGDFIFSISVPSFFQVNNSQAEVLYKKAVEYAGLTGKETVIDAYCGTGTISLFMAKKAQKVVGIEIVDEAVEDARRNALANNVWNVKFKQAQVEKILPDMINKRIPPELVVVNPPRRGCEPPLIHSLIKAKIKRIVYISCNPATLARDLKLLAEGGYCLNEVQPVDMFPQTAHVETVVLMSRVAK